MTWLELNIFKSLDLEHSIYEKLKCVGLVKRYGVGFDFKQM